MLLTLTTTYRPATDLGFLLHKNPARCQSFSLSFGQAHVFYPEAAEDRCTAALLFEAKRVAGRFGYTVEFRGVGPEHADLGLPAQMGVFQKAEARHG